MLSFDPEYDPIEEPPAALVERSGQCEVLGQGRASGVVDPDECAPGRRSGQLFISESAKGEHRRRVIGTVDRGRDIAATLLLVAQIC